MRPVTESLEYLDISSGASKDFNKFVRSVGQDITDVFNMANENEELTEKSMSIVIQENLFLQRKINELENKLASVEQTMANRANGIAYNYLYKTFYTADDIEYSTKQIYHDPSYGIVTLPHTNNQKIPLLKYQKEFLRKNIDIKVELPGFDTVIDMANDPSLLNIIDGDESTFWVTTIDTELDVDYIEFSVTINMPLRILPNLAINAVGIKPHPSYSMTLQDIVYTSSSNGEELRLPTFPVSNEEPIEIQAIDNLKFMFPVINTNSITFNFRQPYYIQNGDVKKFIIGIRNIDLENLNITSEEASFTTAFKIPGENRYFLRILEPMVSTLNNESYGDAVTHELFYDKESTSPFVFGSDIAADIDTVYIKTTLKRTGNIVPAVKGIRLQYLYK